MQACRGLAQSERGLSGRWQASDGGRSPGHWDSGCHFIGGSRQRRMGRDSGLNKALGLGPLC